MRKRITASLLLISLLVPFIFSGCTHTTTSETEPILATQDTSSTSPTEVTSATTTNPSTEPPATEPPATEPPTEPAVTEPPATEPPATEPSEEVDEYGLTEQQRNSFSMLYFLAITAEEIRISKDNSLVLEDIYTSLFNDINPGAIDETTQTHLENLRNVIEDYIDISTKRERLQYLYNQDKAASIRSAVPNPLAILSMTNSLDWKKLATSVVFTVVDSYNNYQKANEAADQEFLMNGWELDDDATEAMRKNRKRAFNYMVDIVQEYGLDGTLTLNEVSIETFAEICKIESLQEKIRRLESEKETYILLGNYWLELADCYFQTEQYKKCLECVETYNSLSTGIYRKDFNYVQILPKAIVAAQKTSWGESYIQQVGAFADDILENTATTDWSVRYFAAQVYLDLYARTDDRTYLEKAYNIAYDNVTVLLSSQRQLNEIYIAEVKEVTIQEPDYKYLTEAQKKEAEQEYKEESARLKAYNKALVETRKTELPPLYEPLILNCDLLFALADELKISYKEKAEIEDILQIDSNGVFLSDAINDRYSFSDPINDYQMALSTSEITIPASLLAAGGKIVVTVSDGTHKTTYSDFSVDKVERKGSTVADFMVHLSSKEFKSHTWTSSTTVTVEIYNGTVHPPIVFTYKVSEYKDNWIIPDKVVFEEV